MHLKNLGPFKVSKHIRYSDQLSSLNFLSKFWALSNSASLWACTSNIDEWGISKWQA